jgi:cation:H+ antiporter
MVYELLLIIVGLAGLWFISSYVVEAAKRLAEKLHVAPIVIGLTITSIGTSLPEIATNISAGLARKSGIETSGIAIGNIVGANLGQITIILGIVGLFAYMRFKRKELLRNSAVMIAAIIILFFLSLNGLSRGDGYILIGLYVVYIIHLLYQHNFLVHHIKKKGQWFADFFIIMIGLILIVFSAKLLVNNAVLLTKNFHINDYLIGFFIGLGTSLPELTVSLRAALKKAGGLSIGNLIGSNITDPLLSLGLGASIAGYTVAKEILYFDFVYWLVASLIAFFLLWNHTNLNKKESSILILLYFFFIYMKIVVL